MINIGSRLGQAGTTYKVGGEWHREMLVQSAGFTAGFATCSGVIAAGTALALTLSLTPDGWVAIIAVIAGAAMAVDHLASWGIGSIYDMIVAWLS